MLTLRGRVFCKIANAQRKQTSQLFQNRYVELSIQKSTVLSLLFYQNDIFHKIDTLLHSHVWHSSIRLICQGWLAILAEA